MPSPFSKSTLNGGRIDDDGDDDDDDKNNKNTSNGNIQNDEKVKKQKGVRFDQTAMDSLKSKNNPIKSQSTTTTTSSSVGILFRKKRPRPVYNADELDDVDDWNPAEDDDDDENDHDDDGNVLSERALQQAKRRRRLKREKQHLDEKDDSIINNDDMNDDDNDIIEDGNEENDEYASTSLLAEVNDDDGGVPITPFNMDDEETDGTGYFDGDTYVFRHGNSSGKEQEEPDAWVDSLEEQQQDTGNAINNNNRTNYNKISQPASEVKQRPNFDDWTEQELFAKILPFVSDTETITQAIVRYGSLIQHNHKQPKKKTTKKMAAGLSNSNDSTNSNTSSIKNEASTQSEAAAVAAASQRAQDALNEITEASNALLLKGQVDIYQKTRNDLLALLSSTNNRTGSTDESSTVAANNNNAETSQEQQQQPASVLEKRRRDVQWEYEGSQDGQIHGPFTTLQMMQWIAAGYFRGDSAVKVRTVTAVSNNGSTNSSKNSGQPSSQALQDDLLKDLMDDDDDDDNDDEDADNANNDTKVENESHPNGQAQNEASKTREQVLFVRGDWEMSDQVDFQKYS